MVSKQDETFLAIAQAGSVSKAAQGLYLSQPAVSRSLKRLEEDLGVQLFDREAAPLRLTQAGERYLRYVRENQERERRLRQDLAQLEREPSGAVRVGLNFWRSSLVLPRVLPAFQRKYPHIQVEPAEGSHQDLSVLLDQGKLDFALLHRPNPYPQFAFQHLRHERILLFLRRDAPVLERLSPAEGDRGLPHLSWPELSALQDTPFLLLKKGQNLREQAEYIFQSAGIQPPAALTTLSLTTALGLAAEGCGAVLASEAVLDGDFLPPSSPWATRRCGGRWASPAGPASPSPPPPSCWSRPSRMPLGTDRRRPVHLQRPSKRTAPLRSDGGALRLSKKTKDFSDSLKMPILSHRCAAEKSSLRSLNALSPRCAR